MGMVITVILISGMISTAQAREGFYFGGVIPFNKIQGNYEDSQPTMNLIGFGYAIGYVFTENIAVEFDWAMSKHYAAGTHVTFSEVSVNGKFSFPASKIGHPYFLFGYGIFSLGNWGMTYNGKGHNLGIGTDYYITPKLSAGAAIIEKIIEYDRIIKSHGSIWLLESRNGDTTSVRLDITYHF
jgi:hypothetical protein